MWCDWPGWFFNLLITVVTMTTVPVLQALPLCGVPARQSLFQYVLFSEPMATTSEGRSENTAASLCLACCSGL